MRGCRGRRKEPFLKRFFLLPLQRNLFAKQFKDINYEKERTDINACFCGG